MDDIKKDWMAELEQFEPDLFWEKHGRKVIWATVAVLGVFVVAYLWQRQRASEEEQAATRLAMATDLSSLQQLIQENSGREVAAVALMRLADLHFRGGRYAEAATAYQKLLDSYPRHFLAEGARLGLASIQEAQGNFEAAKIQYQQLATAGAGYTILAARLGVARCADALGQVKEARQLYEEALAGGQNSPVQQQAFIRWTVLGRGQQALPTTQPASLAPLPTSLGAP